jgi:hypothetical protein
MTPKEKRKNPMLSVGQEHNAAARAHAQNGVLPAFDLNIAFP